MALPLSGPARPGTQAGEDGGTLNCAGASLGSRTRLCLPGKLRESEAAGVEVPAASQRGRLVQGSQPGPALMLGPAAHSSRAGPGGAPHSLTLTGTDCASFSAPPAPFPLCGGPLLRLLLLRPPSQPPPCAAAGLRSVAGSPLAPGRAPLPLGLGLRLTFPPPESSSPSRAPDFRVVHGRKAETWCFTGAGARKVSV